MLDRSEGTYESSADIRDSLAIQDRRAHWIWTSNPGTTEMSEGSDERIYCRTTISAACSLNFRNFLSTSTDATLRN